LITQCAVTHADNRLRAADNICSIRDSRDVGKKPIDERGPQ
jgi:hypothetical protein